MSRILILGGGVFQIAVVREAQALGLRTLVVDRSPGCPAAELADEFYPIDFRSVSEVLELACAHKVDAVVCIAVDAEDTAAYLASKLGLPGPPLGAAVITRDKTLFYRAMEDAGLRIPAFAVGPLEDPPFLPCVVSPPNLSASRGTSICRSREEWSEGVARAGSPHFLVRELLPEGREFSTEIIFLEEQPVFLNTVERFFISRSLGFIELGHVSPAPLDGGENFKLYELACNVADALGVFWGVVKVDTLWPSGDEEPWLLEATLRLSGGADSTGTYPLAYGKSSVRAYIKLALGESVRMDDFTGPAQQYAAAAGYTLPSGYVSSVPDLDELAKKLDLEAILSRVDVYSEITNPLDCTIRSGFALAVGQSPEEAWLRAVSGATLIPAFYGM